MKDKKFYVLQIKDNFVAQILTEPSEQIPTAEFKIRSGLQGLLILVTRF